MLPKNEPIFREIEKNLTVFIYGEVKSGKTKLASTFPNPLILSTDNNVGHLTCPAIHLASFTNHTLPTGHIVQKSGWEVLRETVNELMHKNNQPGYGYQTVVLDLIEDIYELARQHFLRELGVDDEMDVKFGKGYDRIRKAFYQIIIDLKSCVENLVIISHQKNIANSKAPVPEFVPVLSDKVRDKVFGYTTLTIYQKKAVSPDGKNIQYLSYLESVTPFAGYRYNWYIPIPQPVFAIPSDYKVLQQVLIANREAMIQQGFTFEQLTTPAAEARLDAPETVPGQAEPVPNQTTETIGETN